MYFLAALSSYNPPSLLFSPSSFIVTLVMAMIEARLSEISPILNRNTPRSLPLHKSVSQVGENMCSLVQCITAGVFLPVSQYTLICEPMLRGSLGSLRHLSTLSFSAYSPPAWQKSPEDNCSVRRQQHIAGGWGVVCFIKHDPSALWKSHFILTARTFILPELGGKRHKQIDFEKALTAVHLDLNEKRDVY